MGCVESFAPAARQAVRLAAEESDRLGHCYLGCEHLLAGLAQQTDDAAGRALERHGLDIASVRAGLQGLVADGVLPPPGFAPGEQLARLGIDLGEVVERAERRFGADAVRRALDRAGADTGPPWGKSLIVRQAYWFAAREAGRDGAPAVGSTHLLLGVLIDARNDLDTPRCFRNPWQRRRRARLGLPQDGPSPVRRIVEERGISLTTLRKALQAELRNDAASR